MFNAYNFLSESVEFKGPKSPMLWILQRITHFEPCVNSRVYVKKNGFDVHSQWFSSSMSVSAAEGMGGCLSCVSVRLVWSYGVRFVDPELCETKERRDIS